MAATDPGRDCPLCPRLVAFRQRQRAAHPDWQNAPVPSFGSADGKLLIVGLAPGLQGANRTGRPFTGDYAGDLLYETLIGFGLATGTYGQRPDDGLALVGTRITNAVRCVPPENKPTTEEIHTCRPFLSATLAEMGALKAVLALGKIGHDSVVRALGERPSRVPFKHGGMHRIGAVTLFSSYHCSRYNTNTRVLTPDMFRTVFSQLKAHLDAA
ncbi:uracil-DNA glycosylase [Phreatobacter aquaticus]|uniref:Type-5 uracil-DNA glycosylase n=1 Tax=Phreatobacter aquaticus TaxID=2570229 RepID=A0A4D7QK98_9HYPH|nr:uracil-DNA glycosylase [Phreatobacter aquaticus]QCK87041.1 uracil-DNA glycosylase [Phreatobacter aquaticus]